MSDEIATAALSRVTGLMYAALAAIGLSFFIFGGVLRVAAVLLALGGLAFALTTKPIDEESAPAHRKKQLMYAGICVAIAVFSGFWLL